MNRAQRVGWTLLGALLLVVACAPWLAPHAAGEQLTDHAYAPPTHVRVRDADGWHRPFIRPHVLEDRLREAAKLGFKRAVVPEAARGRRIGIRGEAHPARSGAVEVGPAGEIVYGEVERLPRCCARRLRHERARQRARSPHGGEGSRAGHEFMAGEALAQFAQRAFGQNLARTDNTDAITNGLCLIKQVR